MFNWIVCSHCPISLEQAPTEETYNYQNVYEDLTRNTRRNIYKSIVGSITTDESVMFKLNKRNESPIEAVEIDVSGVM